jgi:5-methylcytosine-specific restriction endonuclease McrA
MAGSLVLNATFEPLSVVAVRRAICLILDEKAEILETGKESWRSERLSVPMPQVIRLRQMVKVPYRRVQTVSRRGVFARDDHRCQYCGDSADSIDHVMPRSRGGSHVWENVVAACRRCNLHKRDRTPEEAGMTRVVPRAPMRPIVVSMLGGSQMPETWKPYLQSAW